MLEVLADVHDFLMARIADSVMLNDNDGLIANVATDTNSWPYPEKKKHKGSNCCDSSSREDAD